LGAKGRKWGTECGERVEGRRGGIGGGGGGGREGAGGKVGEEEERREDTGRNEVEGRKTRK